MQQLCVRSEYLAEQGKDQGGQVRPLCAGGRLDERSLSLSMLTLKSTCTCPCNCSCYWWTSTCTCHLFSLPCHLVFHDYLFYFVTFFCTRSLLFFFFFPSIWRSLRSSSPKTQRFCCPFLAELVCIVRFGETISAYFHDLWKCIEFGS